MKDLYEPFGDPGIIAILGPEDYIYGQRVIDGVTREVKYRIMHKPVFMLYSGNWTIRAYSKGLNEALNFERETQLTEYLYLNIHCIHKYRFKHSHIVFYKHQLLTGKIKPTLK